MDQSTLLHDVEAAALRMYESEVALHIAHQTRVDAWVSAAADRLHEAIVEHGRARAAVAQAA